MVKKFKEWRWNTTCICAIEVLLIVSACMGCAIYAPGIIRMIGVVAALIMLTTACVTAQGMFCESSSARTIDEVFSECESKGDKEDRA